MPDVDGYTLTTQIKNMPGLQTVPILALTANVMRGDREKSLEAGCDGYIQKPIDIDSLSQTIERHLRKPITRETLEPVKEDPIDTQPQPQRPSIPHDATVLVVEDNVFNFVLIARMLGSMGVHCEWKTSGYEVVEYADTLPRLDLILMDIRLPYEDGYGALKKIRAAEHLKEIPIVVITAEASLEQIEKARSSGFDGFLGKPLDPDRFPDQIRRILTGEPVWEMA